MEYPPRVALAYQGIGEFVVAFQWVEDLYRQIGWLILDPERRAWPPRQLRKESNAQLIETVTEMFVALTERYDLPTGPERAKEFVSLKAHFHALRTYRNRILHSTFVELKAGGGLVGYLRSNPKIGVDPDSGELIYDRETLSLDSIRSQIAKYSTYAVQLSNHYTQMIHWLPFEQFPRKQS